MPWRTMDVQQQRVEFVISAKRGSQPFRALCQEFGISRPTGYLWLHRYEQLGVSGIAEHSRRPRLSPRRTATDLEQRVIAVRERYPDWGARKLREILAREGIALARNTIHRILLRHGLVEECDQHPPALQRFEREQPNQLWQMDFKGPRGWPQLVGPLSVLDDHSRYVRAGGQRQHARAACARATGKRVLQLWRAGSNADGPRHPVVETARGVGKNQVVAVADAPGDPLVLEPSSAPADAGESGTISWLVAAGVAATRGAAERAASVAG